MPIERLVVVGDAHLGVAPAPIEDALLQFLDAVPTLGDGLLITGDLFGFWFAYRRAIPRAGIRVVARLAALARAIPVMLIGGNHDRWGDPFWESELGIRYGAQELRFSLGGSTALALHGDGFAEPTSRAALKQRIISSRIVSAAYRALPAELGFSLANRLGGSLERSERAIRLEAEAARLQALWAEQRLRTATDISLLIMGHTHRPAVLEVAPGRRYLNPGAWLDGGRYAIATGGQLELRQYPGS